MYDINILTSNGIDVNSSLELFGNIDTYNDTVGEFLISAKEKIVLLEDYKNKKDFTIESLSIFSANFFAQISSKCE